MDILAETDEHLSVSDIYMKAHSVNPDMGLTTIYRTLDVLEQMGMVHKFDFGEGKCRYELLQNTGSSHHHNHLICTRCKRIIDYDEFLDEELALIQRIQEKLSRKYNYEIENHVMNFYGLCESCREAG